MATSKRSYQNPVNNAESVRNDVRRQPSERMTQRRRRTRSRRTIRQDFSTFKYCLQSFRPGFIAAKAITVSRTPGRLLKRWASSTSSKHVIQAFQVVKVRYQSMKPESKLSPGRASENPYFPKRVIDLFEAVKGHDQLRKPPENLLKVRARDPFVSLLMRYK
jgi:hypothetical protein